MEARRAREFSVSTCSQYRCRLTKQAHTMCCSTGRIQVKMIRPAPFPAKTMDGHELRRVRTEEMF
eukprot:scaffold325706_cov37-Tisochrysis_lutea.AAC.1